MKLSMILVTAFAAGSAPAQIGTGGELVSGTVVDAKGYPLRNAFIVAEGAYDTADAEGKFGTGRGPIVGVPRPARSAGASPSLAGSTLRLAAFAAGPARLSLVRPTGARVAVAEAKPQGGFLSVDLAALAGAAHGLFVLSLETPGRHERFLLARAGSSGWILSAAPERASQGGPARAAKTAALPATVRISKPGYEAKTVTVPPGGNLGKVTLAADWLVPVVDAPFDVASFYAPSGWSGDFSKVAVAADNKDNLRPGDPDQKHTRWTYTPPPMGDTASLGWAAVAWQYPENNWGGKPGRKVTGATRITFWARGGAGGEYLDIKAGDPLYEVVPEPGKYRDSFIAILQIQLTAEWQLYEVPLDPGSNTSSTLTGFIWAMTAPASPEPVVFYLDEMRFD